MPTQTAAAGVKALGAAPLSSTPTTQSKSRRLPQSQGIQSGLPILVESSGPAAIWAGDIVVWATNLATSTSVLEASGTITPTSSVQVNNPAFQALDCSQAANAGWCAAQPGAWTFGTSSAQLKPIGAQTLTVLFGDGTTGSIMDYIYPSFSLNCNTGFVFQSGAIVPTTTQAGSDVYADCVNARIDFPGGGGLVIAQPSQDQYGRYETIFPTITASFVLSVLNGSVPMSVISQGIAFGIQTNDGGFAKVYFEGASSATPTAATGMALHANFDGTYTY